MSSFLELPIELVRNITDRLDKADNCSLRQACKALEQIVAPQLFRTLSIDVKKDTDKALGLVEYLARNANSFIVVEDVRELRIGSLHGPRENLECNDHVIRDGKPGKNEGVIQAHLERHLALCLSRLTGLTCLRWSCAVNADAQWALAAVCTAISSLPITDLYLDVSQYQYSAETADPFRTISRLSGLRKFHLNNRPLLRKHFVEHVAGIVLASPNLESLDLDGGYRDADECVPTLQDIFGAYMAANPGRTLALKHLGYGRLDVAGTPADDAVFGLLKDSLVSLRTRNRRNSGVDGSALWPTLAKLGVQLKELEATGVSSALLQYVASYSGLERLVLWQAGARSTAESDALAETFWAQALPRHVETLKKLTVKANFEGAWCYGPLAATVIGQCGGLRELAMAACQQSWPSERLESSAWWRTWKSTQETEGGSFSGTVVTPAHGRPRGVQSAEQVNGAVTDAMLLLEDAARLGVETLNIFASAPERERHARCGTGRLRYKMELMARIVKTVKNLAPLGPEFPRTVDTQTTTCVRTLVEDEDGSRKWRYVVSKL